MKTEINIIAIGRSGYLFDSIVYLGKSGYKIKAIITDDAYDEYAVNVNDFKSLAKDIGCDLYTGKDIYSDEIKHIISSYNIKCAISVNWRFILPQSFLKLFEYGIINFHLGSLPDYKGNATANWAIINGEKEIYASIHKMDFELDSGDIIARKLIPIGPDSYIDEIIKHAEKIVPGLFEESLQKLFDSPSYYLKKGSLNGSRCFPRLPEDSYINWDKDLQSIYRLIRASSRPFSGAYSFSESDKIIIWRAKPYSFENRFFAIPGHIIKLIKSSGNIVVACNDGMIEIEEIEFQGKIIKPMDIFNSIRVRLK